MSTPLREICFLVVCVEDFLSALPEELEEVEDDEDVLSSLVVSEVLEAEALEFEVSLVLVA